jgi:hypothetical protein
LLLLRGYLLRREFPDPRYLGLMASGLPLKEKGIADYQGRRQ